MADAEAHVGTAVTRGDARPWSRAVDEVVRELGVDPSLGLSHHEAVRRAHRFGRNRLRETRRTGPWQLLANQFRSLVVVLLAAAALISFAFGHWVEGVAVAIVLAINAAIGFVTELRAVRSMEALRQLGTTTAKVRREGAIRELPAIELVPGDVVLVEAGAVVTADLRLIEASKMEAGESALTGESAPVPKRCDPVAGDALLAERTSMLFKGTAVTRGAGAGVVTATGMATELGRIASLAQEAEKAATPLEQRLERLGRRLIWVTLAIALVTTVAGVVRGKPVLLMVETGIALAVAAIPEGLPIVATLALARGMWRMARRHALVNRLSAVETLGATTVILTDKTGTLTENQMTVVSVALADDDVQVEGRGLERSGRLLVDGRPVELAALPELRAALEVGLLCNNAALEEEADEARAVGDPMEAALLVLGAKAGLDRQRLLAASPERREEAFDPQTRAMATCHAVGDGFRVAVKGAAEHVVAASRRQRRRAGTAELTDADRAAWRQRGEAMARAGLRVLAVAEKSAAQPDEPPYEDLTLLGLLGMLDPPRERVREVLEVCREAGVRVVMVTGDQAGTALAVARDVGLADEAASEADVVHGRDVPSADALTEADRRRLLAAALFARVDPEQKLRLIELHQRAGNVVAMTGDGVNDAPALRAADIGVAMGRRGTQVAREAADMVLLDDAFESIVRAILQGRVIFANIRRFVLYLLSCNISEILVVFAASIFGAPLPLLPLQILYLNLVTDVFPALALGFGEGDEHVMRRGPRPPTESIMTPRHWRAVAAYGTLIGASVLAALWIATERLGLAGAPAVTVSFLSLAFSQLWHVFNMRDRRSPVLANDVVRSPWIWGAVGLCVVLLVMAVRVPLLATALGTADPGPAGWTVALATSLVPLTVGQAGLLLARPARRGDAA
jgi:Ca2+-transporting ATPase